MIGPVVTCTIRLFSKVWRPVSKVSKITKHNYTNDSYSRLTKDKTNQDFSFISIQNSVQVFWSRYSFFLPLSPQRGQKVHHNITYNLQETIENSLWVQWWSCSHHIFFQAVFFLSSLLPWVREDRFDCYDANKVVISDSKFFFICKGVLINEFLQLIKSFHWFFSVQSSRSFNFLCSWPIWGAYLKSQLCHAFLNHYCQPFQHLEKPLSLTIWLRSSEEAIDVRWIELAGQLSGLVEAQRGRLIWDKLLRGNLQSPVKEFSVRVVAKPLLVLKNLS